MIKGNIVKIAECHVTDDTRGYYRITSISNKGQCANLGSIFGNTIYHKRVPLDWLVECESEWYTIWRQSETYMSM